MGQAKAREGAVQCVLRLLAYRQRSVKEAQEKLESKGFSPEEIMAAIDHLSRLGYLNDEKFAHALVESRSTDRRWGRRKIAAELISKGIEADTVKEALSGLGHEAEAAAGREAVKKWLRERAVRPPLSPRDFERAMRHLISRGFQASLALDILSAYRKAD
ncbi:MAG: recombination regulator RecX, partial [Deltaproteobacteria bacterium]|nr:recombination regulator RecX [Deltaproteobacteria bacterium]